MTGDRWRDCPPSRAWRSVPYTEGMSSDAPSALDAATIEARTQAIGCELIAAAKQAHAHFSVLNRWTEQVLSWCMRDPALKAAVLRFIDVLPSLRGARDVARHVREYFPRSESRLPPALRVGVTLTRGGVLTAPAVAAVVHQLSNRWRGSSLRNHGPSMFAISFATWQRVARLAASMSWGSRC